MDTREVTACPVCGRRTPDRDALVEVARRATLEVMRSIAGPSFVVEPDWCERIVSEYLAEQAGRDDE